MNVNPHKNENGYIANYYLRNRLDNMRLTGVLLYLEVFATFEQRFFEKKVGARYDTGSLVFGVGSGGV